MKYRITLIFLITLFSELNAELLNKYIVSLGQNELFVLEASKPVSSLVIKTDVPLSKIHLIIDSEDYELSSDPHAVKPSSNLIFPRSEVKKIIIRSSVQADLELYTLHVPPLKIDLNKVLKNATDSCEKPAGIDQSIWRAGLPPPTVSPTLNQVSHCIIHHSAGSNTATDYTEVVRNIYLYHTGVNGWDDIGYNFLIAQDGTLFFGRDGMNIIADDNVRGAHFCSKNSGTMGICILGNYMTAVPSVQSLETLKNLLLWKLNKESLIPSDSSIHPLPGGAPLGHIAGHQDGCATDCPGTFLYAEIPGIRNELDNRITNCPPAVALSEDEKDFFSYYPLPFGDQLIIESDVDANAILRNLQGVTMLNEPIERGKNYIYTSNLRPGIYLIELQSEHSRIIKRVICSD